MTTPTPPTEAAPTATSIAPTDGLEQSPPAPAAPRRPLAAFLRWDALLMFFVTLIVYAMFTPHMTTYLNPVSGDEPYYLIDGYSLIEDGDINECNNFRQHEYDKLYPAYMVQNQPVPDGWLGWTSIPYPLPTLEATLPFPRVCNPDPNTPMNANGATGELYSLHGIGLSLLIVPALAIAGRIGVVFFLNFLGALVAANIYMLAREGTGRRVPALLTWLAFALSIPLFAYSFVVFTEMPAALLLIYALRRIIIWRNNLWQMLGIGLCIGFLPSLHYRYATLSAVLFAYYAYQAYRDRATFRQSLPGHIIVLLTIVGGAILVIIRDLIVYHQLLPGAELYATTDMPLVGIFGNFLDQQFGLFIAAPIFILTIVGIILMVMRRGWRGQLLWLALLFIPHFLLISNFIIWWGSWCPPARYLVSALPLFVLPFAFALDQIRLLGYKIIYAALMAPTLGMMLVYILQPHWMYVQGESQFFQESLIPFLARQTNQPVANFNLDQIIPAFSFNYFHNKSLSYIPLVREAWQASLGVIGVIGLIVLLSLVLYWWQQRQPRRFVFFDADGPAQQFAPPAAPPLHIPLRLVGAGAAVLIVIVLGVVIVRAIGSQRTVNSVAVSAQTLTPLPTPTALQAQLVIPAGTLNLVKPMAIAVDEGGNVYIGDEGTMSISKYTAAGHFTASWPIFGGPNGDTSRHLSDLAMYKDQLYVTVTPNPYIEVYNADGKLLGKRTAGGSNQLTQPAGLCLDSSGNLYVADAGSQRILKLDDSDHLIATIGASDTLSPEQRLNGASDCAVAADGAVYATDSQQRLLKYNSDGSFAAQWLLALNGNMKHLALDGNRLYIGDQGSNSIVVFDTAAQKMSAYGGPGNDPGQFSGLASIATDGKGKLYAVEANNAWAQVFSAP